MSTPRIAEFYSRALREGTNAAERVGWASVGVQKLRFEVFLDALHPTDITPSLRVLDVGCGCGDLLAHLLATGREVDYHGIDVHPEMVAEARKRLPEGRFDVADVLDLAVPDVPDYDLVICSGALSLRFETEELTWAVVERLCQLAGWAAVFNLQSTRPLAEQGAAALRTDFLHVDAPTALRRVHTFCRDVVVREDVVPSDIFFACYRGYCRDLRHRPELTALERAEVLVQRRAFDAALDELDAVPGALSARARYLRGVACAYLDRDEEARRELLAAYELAPEDIDTAEGLVHFALASDDQLLAERVVSALETSAASSGGARRDKVRQPLHEFLVFHQDVDGAMAVEDALETAWAGHFLRGARLVAERKFDAARDELRAARELEPFNVEPLPLLAVAQVRTGHPEEALELACSVLDVSHDHPVARNVAVEALRKLSRRGRGTTDGSCSARAAIERAAQHAILGAVAARFL